MHFLHGGHAIYRGQCLLINQSAQIMCVFESDMIVFILPVGPGRAFIVSASFFQNLQNGQLQRNRIAFLIGERRTSAVKLSVQIAVLAHEANPTIQIKIACAMPALD
jgi:hypothetical protein